MKPMKHRRGYRSLSSRQNFYGRMFTLPWRIGFILFFLVPVFQSVWYSLSNAGPLDEIPGGLIGYFQSKFLGFGNYRFIWTAMPDFTDNLGKSITDFLYSLPIILVLSLVLALVLNQKFRGRLLARAVFFLPVIIAAGVVMSILSEDMVATQLRNSGPSDGSIYNSVSFTEVLMNLGIPQVITGRITAYITSIFDLLWSSGAQTILFLAALQSVPPALYEVADVEGATPWEKFWFITMPMMMNVVLLNLVYTSIELFTSSKNPAMQQTYEMILQSNYNTSSAIVWSYITILGVILGIIVLIASRITKKLGVD